MTATCQTCDGPLSGRQTRFCGLPCKNADTNRRLQNYTLQQARGLARKRRLVKAAGGACQVCGYAKNLAALCFHHRRDKLFQISSRELSNRSWAQLTAEAAKCDLLCHNCHMEEHYPGLAV